MSRRADSLDRLADEDLMPLVAGADARAFEVVYDRHAGAAYALAHRICGNAAAADDVCQEAFLAAWRSAARYDARAGSVRGWLLTIVHHRAIDHVRRVTRMRDRTTGDAEAAERVAAPDDVEAGALVRADREAAAGLLGLLGDDQRRIVELVFYSGYTHSEIAALLDLPLGTVKTRMRLALQKLRSHLQESPA